MAGLWQKLSEILRLIKISKRWQKLTLILSAIVIFCTTYMLILPALTMENNIYCGYDEHIHDGSCYEAEEIFICETEDLSDSGHTHTEDCYEKVLKLICTLPEHSHTETCYLSDEASLNKATDGNVPAQDYAVNLMSDEYDIEALADTVTASRVNFDTLDGTGDSCYIVYTSYNGSYYAVDGNGNAVSVTVGDDGSVTSASMGDNIFWSFYLQSGSTYKIQNLGTSRYMHAYYNSSTNFGVTTSGDWTSDLVTSGTGSSKTFSVKSNSNYSRILSSSGSVVFQTTTTASSAARFYLAEVTMPKTYNVWFDGTCGGLMSLWEADNTRFAVSDTAPDIILPTTWKSPSKYDYVINGWYDIKNHTYHKPGDTVAITGDTVFYADWVAATYDVGQNNSHVVPSLDTNSFIKTDVFDYSAVFNFQAVTHTGTVSSSGHDETWSVVQNNTVPYNNAPSLGFIFRDWDSGNKHISYASNRARLNDNQGTEITSQIVDYVYDMSGKNLIDVLFDENTPVIGKNYVGTGNYLYQFMDKGSSNYDGIHNGYYYYDATLNAASYNQTDKRFYIYDYLERTSDSFKDSFDSNGNPTASGAYSDFLPFNSPYVNNSNNKTIVDYADKNGKNGNHQYDAKATNQQSAAGNAGTNYWFGMKSEIKFYLPNDTGTVDAYGNYGNISAHGEHMNFQFHGDDDIWVFIDGELVMDIGGLHGIMNGKIDFSTGTVTTDYAENNSLVATPTTSSIDLKEGDHSLTIYYMERGGSQANCAIYFNISPRYAMEITKQDNITGEKLDGAEFSVFTDAACTVPATLWNSEADYENDLPGTNVFTVRDGKAYFWGISAGKLYYIKETKAPDGYPVTDDIIRVAMNNLGESVCTTDSLRGENEEHTDGFDVLTSNADEAIHLISVVLTNQIEQPEDSALTNVRVSKAWAEGSENLPDSITVSLFADGVDTGKSAVLDNDNNWTYTWTGLPLTSDGTNTVVYTVREVQVPGFASSVSSSPFTDNGTWVLYESLRDGDTFILVNKSNSNALSVSGGSFTWISKENAESQPAAQWTSVADGMGFHLINGTGYRIILNGTTSFVPTQDGNRILYYYNSKLFAQNGNIYYYFNTNAAADNENGIEFAIYKKTQGNLSGTAFEIVNTPIPESNQTSLSVNKVWSDDAAAHTNDSVTIHLFADGTDTGRTVTLNKANSWTATFDGLIYKHEGSDTPVSYTVKEAVFDGYYAQYSTVSETPGDPITVWSEVTSLEAGKVYRFVYNGYALACNGNNVASLAIDESSDYQKWEIVSYNGNLKLKNLGNGSYLYYYRSLTTSTGYTSNYTNVTFSGGRLTIGNSTNRYITISSGSVSTTTSSSSATVFTALVATEVPGNPNYSITVTNHKAGYVLPATGGDGLAAIYTTGSLLMICALTLLLKSRKKRLQHNIFTELIKC